MRAFYESKVFANFEAPLLKYALRIAPPKEFTLNPFRVGDSIYCWKVIERTDSQILLRWRFLGSTGATW